MAADSIARLKITLDHVKPVTRRIEAPLSLRLDRLHLMIQAAMPWWNYHLWQIRVGDAIWGIPDPDYDPRFSFGPRTVGGARGTLADAFERRGGKPFKYEYDFGDSWEHTIKLERIVDVEAGSLYPRLVDASGCCPPEDCGGPWGYAEYLEALADPAHERHKEMLEWRGPFDPNELDVDALKADVAELAKRWSRVKRKAACGGEGIGSEGR